MQFRRNAWIGACLGIIGALWLAHAYAAEPSTPRATAEARRDAEASGPLKVAKVDGSRAFAGFTKGKALQSRFMALQRELGAARQTGDQVKAEAVGREMLEMQREAQQLMGDALEAVAKEQDIDIVLSMRTSQDGTSQLDTVYQAPGIDVPEITDAVIERINKLAATRPALDAEPAATATRPAGLSLQTRPSLHIEP